MSRLNADNVAAVTLQIDLEELLNDVVPVLEIRVFQLKSKSDENVVVFVIVQTKAISFKHLAVRHTAIANVDLGTFRVHILPSLNLELILIRHAFETFQPSTSSLFLTHSLKCSCFHLPRF